MIDPSRAAELYRISIEEDRYQVQLNWDKTKFLFLLNASLLAAAAALFRPTGTRIASFLILLTFLAACGLAVVGILGLREGKEYHRRAVVKSVVLGDMLGLTPAPGNAGNNTDLTLQLVSGMTATKASEILRDPDLYVTRRLRRWSMSHGIEIGFILFLCLDVAGTFAAVYLVIGCPLGGCA